VTRGPLHIGVVAAFDEARGLGTVSDSSGSEWPFHCTRIADGSRTIRVGTAVVFCVVTGHLGRMEACRVTEVGADGGSDGGSDRVRK